MIPNPSDDQPPPTRPARFQYRLSTLFLLMLVVSVLSAAAAGLVRQGVAATAMPGEFYLVMLIAAPLGVMIVLSLFYAVLRRWGNRLPPNDQDRSEPP